MIDRMRSLSNWLLLLGCVGVTLSDKKIIDCPKSCPVNIYKPICSRGKSYANICVLKSEICKGKIQDEHYQDIEPCPGFNKMEDENGASVEMVDKNGVIFRSFFPEYDPKRGHNFEKKVNEEYSKTRLPSYYKRQIRMNFCKKPCSKRNAKIQVCVLGVPYKNACMVKRLACAGKLSFAALGILEYCDEADAAVETSREDMLNYRRRNKFGLPMYRRKYKNTE